MAAGIATPSRALTPVGSANAERSSTATRPSGPNLFKIDVGPRMAELERVLRAGGDGSRYMDALAILRRW